VCATSGRAGRINALATSRIQRRHLLLPSRALAVGQPPLGVGEPALRPQSNLPYRRLSIPQKAARRPPCSISATMSDLRRPQNTPNPSLLLTTRRVRQMLEKNLEFSRKFKYIDSGADLYDARSVVTPLAPGRRATTSRQKRVVLPRAGQRPLEGWEAAKPAQISAAGVLACFDLLLASWRAAAVHLPGRISVQTAEDFGDGLSMRHIPGPAPALHFARRTACPPPPPPP